MLLKIDNLQVHFSHSYRPSNNLHSTNVQPTNLQFAYRRLNSINNSKIKCETNCDNSNCSPNNRQMQMNCADRHQKLDRELGKPHSNLHYSMLKQPGLSRLKQTRLQKMD